MKQLLSPQQVALAIGVSESSIKRWCDKGVIQTARTAGGHRRLWMNSVARFVRDGGHKVVNAEAIGLNAAVANIRWTIPEARLLFRESLVSGDVGMARSVLLGLYFVNQQLSVIADEVIAGAFHEIGDLWDCGDVEIYEERRACEICLNALRDFGTCLPSPAESARTAIGATMEGDPYSIAVSLGELVLRDNGWDASSLGSSLHRETICAAIQDCRPRLLWVSVSSIADDACFAESMNELFAFAAEHGTALAIGGRALGPDIRRQLRYSTFCDTFQHLEQFAATI